MNLKEFCKLPDTITSDDAQKLNKDLASKSITDIPSEYRSEIESYLCDQFNYGGIHSDLIESLDKLLKDIQENK